MRFLPFALAGAAALATIATAIEAQRPDDQINPKSLALLQAGKAEMSAGQLDAATDTLETALVADPRNRAAYVALGDVARARGLPGLAYRHYRDALELDPNDLAALRGQG
ncbi:tetratricopeptide repeat protein, partial [Escherichia coli]